MNEIIKELANQCGFRSNPDAYDRNQSFDIPKFAELIVQECLSVIEEMNPHDPERHIDCIFYELEKHFGVEE